MSEPTGVQICEYHGREFVWILFNNGWGRGGKERYSLAQAEEIDGPLKPMDYIGTAPQILAELSGLRQELDEARAERDRLRALFDKLLALVPEEFGDEAPLPHDPNRCKEARRRPVDTEATP